MKRTLTSLILLAFGLALGSINAADYSSTSTVPTSPSTVEIVKRTPAMKAGLQNVIIVYKTHFDIGYTTMAREVVHGDPGAQPGF